MSDPTAPNTPSTVALLPSRSVAFDFWRWFWILLLVVSLPYAWYCFYVPANRIAWANDEATARQIAADTSKPVLLFFSGQWCVPCRIMKRNVWADERVRAVVDARFIPVTIDVDQPNAVVLRARYGVRSTPTTIIADEYGTLLLQMDGGVGQAEFLQRVEALERSRALR